MHAHIHRELTRSKMRAGAARWPSLGLALLLLLAAAARGSEQPSNAEAEPEEPNATAAGVPQAAEVRSLPAELLPDWSDLQHLMEYASDVHSNLEYLMEHWWQEVSRGVGAGWW